MTPLIIAGIQFLLLFIAIIFLFKKDDDKSMKILFKIALIFIIIDFLFLVVVLYEQSNRCAPGYCPGDRNVYSVELPQ